jgi:hypothetical protein
MQTLTALFWSKTWHFTVADTLKLNEFVCLKFIFMQLIIIKSLLMDKMQEPTWKMKYRLRHLD